MMNPRSSAPAVKYLEVIVDKQEFNESEARRRKIKIVILHENVCSERRKHNGTTTKIAIRKSCSILPEKENTIGGRRRSEEQEDDSKERAKL